MKKLIPKNSHSGPNHGPPTDSLGEAALLPVKILLIEDNPGDVELVRKLLVNGGHSAFTLQHAATLAAGLEMLGRGGNDVVLLDLNLPESRGLDTLEKVHAQAPQMPIVVFTGIEGEELAVEAMSRGAQDYLVKGQIDSSLLARAIRYAVERKQAEGEVQRQKDLQEALLNALSNAGQGLAIVDGVAQRFLFVNDAACRISGYSRDELLDLPSFFDLVAPEECVAFVDTLARRLRGEPVSDRTEATALHRDGRRINLEVTVQPTTWVNQDQLIVIFRDITKRKQAERDLANARDAAIEASRLKSAILTNMSHEIRTPLNILLGYSSLIEDHLRDLRDGSQQELFAAIHRAGRRLMETVHHVLDLSKIETGNFAIEPTRFLLAPVVEREVAGLRKEAEEKGIALDCRIDASEVEILFDEYCLARAISHLLENAIKFTHQGRITVRLDRRADGILRLQIRDTGIGIDAAFLSRLFEPFSQEDSGYTRRFEGAGLGLALVKKYLELNGARVTVESEKGVGSTFTIEFGPKSDLGDQPVTPASVQARSDQTAATRTEHRPTVLVVEDDPDTQAYMKAVLDKRFDVLAAASADEARRELARHTGEIPVILMDLSLRGSEDGLSLTRSLREQEDWKDVPIIATTAHALPEDRRRALAAGCSDYLAKPFGRDELLSSMDRALRHG